MPDAEAQRKKRKKKKSKVQREADRHFKTGVRLFEEGKYAEALAEFEQAYALVPHPLVLYNLASAHRALSQYDQAVDFYNRFMRDGDGTVSAKQLARGKKELDQLLKQIARVEVHTEPKGAMVTVDGREVDRSPLSAPLILGPGDHVITAELDGYDKKERKIRVASGDALRVDISLVKIDIVDDNIVKDPVDNDPSPLTAEPSPRRIGVSAAVATNALEAADVGTAAVGLEYAVTDRLSFGVDLVIVAFSVIPEVRFRLFGDKLSLHAIAAVPVSFKDGDSSETFVAGAGGLGLRYRPTPMLAFRVEGWVSYAGSDRGTTVPAFAGAELWF